MHPRASKQRLEMVIGLFGFFAVVAALVAVVTVAQGGAVRQPLIVFLGFLALFGFALRVHQRM